MAKVNKASFKKLKDTIKEIENSIFPTLQQVFTTESDEIKDIQTDVQLFTKSEDRLGIKIHPKYTDFTISIKLSKGQPTDRVTLKDTGAFYRSINVVANSNQLIIETSIEYARKLVEKYGKDILGIQDMEMKEFVIRFVMPQIKKNISNIIERNRI